MLSDAAREKAREIVTAWFRDQWPQSSNLDPHVDCDYWRLTRHIARALAEAERRAEEFRTKYHEAMDILSAADKIDHAVAVAQLARARQALREVVGFVGHEHFDREGTRGANCPICIRYRQWREKHEAALDAAREA